VFLHRLKAFAWNVFFQTHREKFGYNEEIHVGEVNRLCKRLIKMKNIFLLSLALTLSSYSQTSMVRGNVSSTTGPVKYALVTFVVSSDTTRKFSVLTDTSGNYQLDVITSVKLQNSLPAKFELQQNYPNPFSSLTTISYELKEQTNTSVKIYNILGQLVKEFRMGRQSMGDHGVVWDGTDNLGKRVMPGVYFCQLMTGNKSEVKKMLFGFGVDGTAPLFHPTANPTGKPLKTMNALHTESENYVAKVEETDSTQPRIFAKDFVNLTLSGDTALNFRVDPSSGDHHTLWVVGYDSSPQALALQSSDGGQSWQKVIVTQTPPEMFWDVEFADSSHGWIVGDYRHIWHTSDGGISWQLQFESDPLTDTLGDACIEIAAIDSIDALAATSSGAILRTTDGGKSWQEQRSSGAWTNGFAYVDSVVTYAIDGLGTILKTETDGDDWYPILSDSSLRINDVQFFNRDTGWIGGDKREPNGPYAAFVASTRDGGETWNFKYITDYTQVNTIWFFDLDTGIAEEGVIHRTTDGGNTWSHQYEDPTRPPSGFFRLKFADSFTGWGVGNFGTIKKTVDGGISWNYQLSGYPATFLGLSIIKQLPTPMEFIGKGGDGQIRVHK